MQSELREDSQVSASSGPPAESSAGSLDAQVVIALLDLVDAGKQVGQAELHQILGRGNDVLGQRVVRSAARVARLRRRDSELSALFRSARELVEVRDVQTLLQRLVDRAHDLLGFDITYLSEYDETTDELWVRANRGAASSNMRNLRVPAGMGLASRVVQTRMPQWTADYDEDEGFPRTDEIDTAIFAEHIRSILGIPMVASDHVLGVLFVADRSAHSFSGEDIALLTAFVDQAAVILYTARLLDAERASAAEAEAAHAKAREHAAATERSALVHEELTRLVLSGRGSREVAETLARALERPVALADRDLRETASTAEMAGKWWQQLGLPLDVLQAIERGRHSGHCVRVEPDGSLTPDSTPEILVAVVAGSSLLGAVLIGGGPTSLSGIDMRMVERAAQIVALLTVQQDAVTDAEEQVRGELVTDLVSGRGDLTELRRRAQVRGIELDQPWCAVALLVDDGSRRTALRTLGSTGLGWLVGQHPRGVTVLVPTDDAEQAVAAVHRRFTLTSRVAAIAVAGRVTQLRGLPSEVETAWACATMLPGLGVVGSAVRADAYAPYLAMFGPDAERASAFVHQTIGPVIRWDTDHGTDLANTISCFVENASSLTGTARALFVHTNTVKQRLDRVSRLLGDSWRDPEPLFRIGVAVRLHAVGVRLADGAN